MKNSAETAPSLCQELLNTRAGQALESRSLLSPGMCTATCILRCLKSEVSNLYLGFSGSQEVGLFLPVSWKKEEDSSRGRRFFLREAVKHRTDCPERLQHPCSLRDAKLHQTRPWVTSSNCQVSSAFSMGLEQMTFKHPFQSMFFYSLMILITH